MTVTLKVKANQASLTALKREMGLTAKAVRKQASRAVGDTLKHLRSDTSQELRKILPLKKKLVDKHIELDMPNYQRDELAGEMEVHELNPLSLRLFGARQSKGGEVTVVVDKRSGRQPASQVARTRGGQLSAGEPAFGPRIDKLHKGVFRRRGKKRLPLEKLFGPGVHETFEGEGLDESVAAEAASFLERRTEQRLRWVFEKGGSGA